METKMSKVRESSFSVEDLLWFPETSEDKEPQIEELLNKLRKIQQTKQMLEKDVKKFLSLRSTLQDEESALTNEVLQLQGILNEKEGLYRSLQVKCKDLEQELHRQFKLKQEKEELVQQYSYQIQETKLRHRKIRMKFENQLQNLLGQHKNLFAVFIPTRLPDEILSAEYITEQLLKSEHQKLEHMAHLQEKLSNAQATGIPLDAMSLSHD